MSGGAEGGGEEPSPSEVRDRAGDRRDRAGDRRDRAAEQRDEAAERRDQAAEESEACSAGHGVTGSALSRSALARREAASDRMRASQDRGAGASERTQAELDRHTALVDRGASAREREFSWVAATDAERGRWARELHDETLQGLGALRLLLAGARRRGDAEQTGLAVDEAIERIEQEIQNLHAIISDLRPAALDELGLRPALEALLERRRDHGALAVTSEVLLPDPSAGQVALEPETESTVYRVVQEAVTNVVKHADARNMRIAVTASATAVSIEVEDDGTGFAADAPGSGFGLAGMRERVHLAGGTVKIDSGQAGTRVRVELPARPGGSTGRPAPPSPATPPPG
ncbi:MAG: hypothetical protein QOE44_846 [Solirubrobacteraceae bacterium]|nr:hypothetical protein [Solirubrobacteraceae bacterium]